MSSCFGPIFGGCHQGPVTSTGPPFLILHLGLGRVGLCAYFLNPISYPPALGYGERGQGLYRFLDQARYPYDYLGRV